MPDYRPRLAPRRRSFLPAAILALAITLQLPAQTPDATKAAGAPQIGDVAPELRLAGLLDTGSSKTRQSPPKLADLRGTVVVLEFWTTWCGSCRTSLPHWNALVETLGAGEGNVPAQFVFLGITNEEQAVVERFLSKVARRGLIALDDSDATMSTYDPGTVPHVVVVDRHGKIAAITHASELTESALRAIAAGRPHDLPLKKPLEHRTLASSEPPSERRTQVRATTQRGNRTRFESGRFEAIGLPLSVVLRALCQLPRSQIEVELDTANQLYDVLVEAPTVERSQMREYALDAVCRELEIELVEGIAPADVLVLERIDNVPEPAESEAKKASYSQRGPQLTATRVPMGRLTGFVSALAGGKPVIDETGLTGRYDLDFEVYSKEDLVEQLAQLGVRYVKAVRDVRKVTFRPRTASADAPGASADK